MLCLKKSFNEIVKFYKGNRIVNFILVVSCIVIISFEITQDWPVLFGLNVAAVNYYYEIFIDLSIGYIVSTIFYVLVVYYPERKRNKAVNTKTSIIFARIQTNLRTAIDSFVTSVGVSIDTSNGVPEKYIEIIKGLEPFKLMKRNELNDQFYGRRSALDDFVRASDNIEVLKSKLVSFLAYISKEELDFYSNLEEILTFENTDKLEKLYSPAPKEYLFLNEFIDIVITYHNCQMIVRGFCEEYEWHPKK